MNSARSYFDELNTQYLQTHQAKEDLFWDTYMAISDDRDGFAQAEHAYQAFLSDPEKLTRVRSLLAELETSADRESREDVEFGLRGWLAMFEANIIDNAAAERSQRELVEMETELFGKRRDFKMSHVNERGEREEASLGTLAINIATNPSEEARKGSHDELLRLEQWVLANGFLEIVAKRNEFARALGYRHYFDYKVRTGEKMSPEDLFRILDDFEERTRDASRRSLDAMIAEKGASAVLPHNLSFHISGDVRRQMDPYLPFGKGLERWVVTFQRLGIGFRGAVMQLDLLEREGKYQNGFCHAPVPAFFDKDGHWVAAHVNFTSLAKPGQVGSGANALRTLFHEGGHAAHFANVAQNAPCFSQEYAPTSMAYAETQSMFCDSLLGDADWLKRYALDESGTPIPDELIRTQIEKTQPWLSRSMRNMMVVPYFEIALYEMSDDERTPEAVLALARQTEERIMGTPVNSRPVLSIPHLLNRESAASYHGYLLAEMAVHQTRGYLLQKFGYLTDNSRIGPLLAEHYWRPGNSVDHNATLIGLTGQGFSAKYLADACNQTVEEAWKEAAESIAAAARRHYSTDYPETLSATIRIVDGAKVITDNDVSDADMCARFEAWVGELTKA
ncbi:peptidase [Capsulimonas corticalis]|uniref:Peptidase n=1 Tax=Capsulimonas corticalis TaxID=2219043 RepID=A0A402CY18_9BACT|nr:M3 family metallopeptidase [Capsulimonas corticalis]BDI32102.1 peptidase [Capsulimonas corticalis]